MQPSTSYCPPTSSPGRSFGWKENLVPQFLQKPSTRPARPALPRPTGRSQLLQYRLRSGTSGFLSTAPAGSLAWIGGISIRPAPRLPRPERDEETPVIALLDDASASPAAADAAAFNMTPGAGARPQALQ